jgi:tRNA threonylcarbamoyladenosine biosynthesis protein TsaB
MLILAIDTSTRAGSVALMRDRNVLGEVSAREDIPLSSGLFRDLDLLRSQTTFTMKQVDLFAVASGPGSFTGLRVGLTAVKGWAEVYQRPIAAISALEAIAALATGNHGILSPFLDARRGHVFGSTYRTGGGEPVILDRIGEESILTVEEFLAVVKANCGATQAVLVSPTPGVLSVQLLESNLPGAHLEQVPANLAPMIGRLAFDRANRGDLVDALGLDANYLRRADAEALWKDS